MAAWQASYAIIPAGPFPADYRAQLDSMLPRSKSWSGELELWGQEDGNCVHVHLERGQPTDGVLRVDLRSVDSDFIRHILDFLSSMKFGLEDTAGNWVDPNLGEFTLALKRSSAYRFVENPDQFFRRLIAGGLEDA